MTSRGRGKEETKTESQLAKRVVQDRDCICLIQSSIESIVLCIIQVCIMTMVIMSCHIMTREVIVLLCAV